MRRAAGSSLRTTSFLYRTTAQLQAASIKTSPATRTDVPAASDELPSPCSSDEVPSRCSGDEPPDKDARKADGGDCNGGGGGGGDGDGGNGGDGNANGGGDDSGGGNGGGGGGDGDGDGGEGNGEGGRGGAGGTSGHCFGFPGAQEATWKPCQESPPAGEYWQGFPLLLSYK